MKSINKAQATMRDVAEKLRIRFAGSATIDTVREAADSAGWPMLFCSDGGSEVAGAAVVVLRMKGLAVLPLDQFQQAQFAYAPHKMEVAYELTAANNPIPTDVDILISEFEAINTGVALQLKEIANGTAVSQASMDAATPAIELDNLYWPNKGV